MDTKQSSLEEQALRLSECRQLPLQDCLQEMLSVGLRDVQS